MEDAVVWAVDVKKTTTTMMSLLLLLLLLPLLPRPQAMMRMRMMRHDDDEEPCVTRRYLSHPKSERKHSGRTMLNHAHGCARLQVTSFLQTNLVQCLAADWDTDVAMCCDDSDE